MILDYCVNYLAMKLVMLGLFIAGILLGVALGRFRERKSAEKVEGAK